MSKRLVIALGGNALGKTPQEQLDLVKGTASGEQEISALTGATVTSTAVVNSVNAGLAFFEEATKGGN